MVVLNPEYVVDGQQRRKAVLLSIDEWEQVLEALEDLEDIRAYDEARVEPQKGIPFEDAVKDLEDGSGA